MIIYYKSRQKHIRRENRNNTVEKVRFFGNIFVDYSATSVSFRIFSTICCSDNEFLSMSSTGS